VRVIEREGSISLGFWIWFLLVVCLIVEEKEIEEICWMRIVRHDESTRLGWIGMNGLIERSLLIDEPCRRGQWHPSAMQAVRLDRCSIEVLVDRGAADASGAGVLLRTRFREQSQVRASRVIGGVPA